MDYAPFRLVPLTYGHVTVRETNNTVESRIRSCVVGTSVNKNTDVFKFWLLATRRWVIAKGSDFQPAPITDAAIQTLNEIATKDGITTRSPEGADGDDIRVVAGRRNRSIARGARVVVTPIVAGGYDHHNSRLPGSLHCLA